MVSICNKVLNRALAILTLSKEMPKFLKLKEILSNLTGLLYEIYYIIYLLTQRLYKSLTRVRFAESYKLKNHEWQVTLYTAWNKVNKELSKAYL